MSRIDFAPAHTTHTGVRASSSRSADMSNVWDAPLCTPPMPPVASTRMPASAASTIVPATVVAPSSPRAASTPMSRRDAFATPSGPAVARCSICSADSPMVGRPRMIAIVAGTAPASRAVFSVASAHSMLDGYGNP